MPDDLPPKRPWAAGAAIAAAVAAGAWFAGRSLQQDFAAYWIAGTARRLGLDPYVNHVGSAAAPNLWDGLALFRHSRFLYLPLVADLFRPLASVRYAAAKGLFTAAMLGARKRGAGSPSSSWPAGCSFHFIATSNAARSISWSFCC